MHNPFYMYLGDRRSGADKYLWLCFAVTFPEECVDQDVLGIFDFGITGEGTSKGFESLLYVDGEAYQGSTPIIKKYSCILCGKKSLHENISCLEKIAGLPSVKISFAKEYLDRLNETIELNMRGGYLPIWDGELYLEYHRGTYTSQAYNKKINRRLEFLIRDAEILSVFAMLKSGAEYEADKLYEAWKIIMRNQFHDIIPGSSIHEVYEDCHIEYAQAEQI